MRRLFDARNLPAAVAILGGIAVLLWLTASGRQPIQRREPGADQAPAGEGKGGLLPQLRGKLTQGNGKPAGITGTWPWFRGPQFDGVSHQNVVLARHWPAAGPPVLWKIDLGEGYAGPVIRNGRVYLLDYDRKRQADVARCLSLADGRDIWRFSYPVRIKRNHGMSRTVAAVTDQFLVTYGPKCHVTCFDAITGKLRWAMDLVRQFGAKVPPWYAGQCPLIDGQHVILAPGGTKVLMMSVDLATGKIAWTTPNPHLWDQTHSSVMPMDVAGVRTYVYCARGGVVGVAAKDGKLLWETNQWKIGIATVPSPVILDGGRIFLSGGYNAGSMMLQISRAGGKYLAKILYRLPPEIFGATQQTPIYYNGFIYGVRPDGQMVCLDPSGRVKWASGGAHRFGLGPMIIAGGLVYALNDTGTLTLAEATPAGFTQLAQAKVLPGPESWAPLALAGGRLLARDLNRMVCLNVSR